MNRPRSYVIAALVAMTAIVAAEARDAGPGHERLTAMVGTWDLEITLWTRPGRAGTTAKGTSTITSLLDGLFIEERIDAEIGGAPFTTLAWTGFNEGTQQYEATRIGSVSPFRIAETGVYDEKTNQFELKADYLLAGDTWHQRTVIQPTSADAMTATSYMSFGNVPEWKGVEMKYTRRRPTP
jgi:hypothetical protein